MARFLKTKKEDIGLSPDTLIFRGEKKSDAVLLRVIDFDSDQFKELEILDIGEVLKFNDSKTTTWFNIDGLHDEKIMHEISSGFELEKHILSDVMDTHARPKLQEYDNCLYISIKMLQYNEETDRITSENLVIIIKDNILISFQEKKGDIFEPLRDRIRKNKKRIRTSGTDYLGFALIDIVFDNYKYIISRVGEKIESLEEELLNHPSASILEEINKYKSEIIYLHKSIKPCREMIMDLIKMDADLIEDKNSVFTRELKDNVNHSIESLENYKEILTNQLNMYHTTVSSNLNEIMKFLTVFSVIFIPLTFIAGIYGTNFDFLPELHFKYSYFIMWGLMIAIAGSMITYFRRKKWF